MIKGCSEISALIIFVVVNRASFIQQLSTKCRLAAFAGGGARERKRERREREKESEREKDVEGF